ncbi:hypothetical protein QTN25_003097 [Entamoeba marina]
MKKKECQEKKKTLEAAQIDYNKRKDEIEEFVKKTDAKNKTLTELETLEKEYATKPVVTQNELDSLRNELNKHRSDYDNLKRDQTNRQATYRRKITELEAEYKQLNEKKEMLERELNKKQIDLDHEDDVDGGDEEDEILF